MGFIDVEQAVGDYLRANLPVPVVSKVPESRPDSFVRVWRTGGPVSGRVMERPQMTVEAWSPSKGAASDLGRSVRDLLLAANRLSVAGFHRVQVESFYYDPDPQSGTDRYTLAVFLTVRAARA